MGWGVEPSAVFLNPPTQCQNAYWGQFDMLYITIIDGLQQPKYSTPPWGGQFSHNPNADQDLVSAERRQEQQQ